MKKFKSDRCKWLIIHEHYCQKRRQREKRIASNKNRTKHRGRIADLKAPSNMSLQSNFTEVVTFFNSLREKTNDKYEACRLTVDFESISSLKPGAALVLAAELHRWQELNAIKLKPHHPERWNPNVNRLLNELGLFELLRTPQKFKRKKFYSPGPQTFFKYITNTTSDGELASTLMEKMSPVIGLYYNARLLYVALCEAMTNVLNHAYPIDSDVFDSDIRNRWWLSGSFNKDTKVMTVLLYDQGVGIPATLKNRKSWYENTLRTLKETKDSIVDQGRLIQAAVQVGRSSTSEDHRGKGLMQILKFSSDSKFGQLYIVSRKGEYFFSDEGEETGTCPVELGGTFIQWEIKLEKKGGGDKL